MISDPLGGLNLTKSGGLNSAAFIMKIKILGSAAGGGFPQWNCNCPNCNGLRKHEIKAQARTQSSLAISSASGEDWLLVNASPDILAQIGANPELQPSRALRDSGIAAILLTDAQIDHVAGLLMLREHSRPWPLFATASVWHDLSSGFPISTILSHYCGVDHHAIPLDGSPITDALHGISLTAIALRSKAPPYSPNRQSPTPGDNIGLLIKDNKTGNSAFYAPGLGGPEPHVVAAMNQAQLLLVDGTLWQDDEMITLGLSSKSSLDMGHLPLHGHHGMIELLNSLGTEAHPIRKVLVHINNSNPILREDSPERAELNAQGIEVGFDGMTFDL